MKPLKIVFGVIFFLFFASIWIALGTAIFPLRDAISDEINKEFFVKKNVEITEKRKNGGKSQIVRSFCVINNKSLVIQGARGDVVMIDSSYYVWYNTKTDNVYLTQKESKYYDTYGRLMHFAIMELVIICISVLLFFSMRYLRKIYKE